TLYGAKLSNASLIQADLRQLNAFADPTLHEKVDFSQAFLYGVNLSGANLSGAVIQKGYLYAADLDKTDLHGADLREANLERARLVETNLEGANLRGCRVYGISAWRVNLVGAQQSDLVVTAVDEPELTVDNLEVAQFIYLLLDNEKIREVIDTITSKA